MMLFKDIWTLLIFLSLKYPIQQMRRLSTTVGSVDPHVHQIISCALLSDNHHCDDQIICDTSELGRRTKLTVKATRFSPVKEWR